jgi:hypothetical protein
MRFHDEIELAESILIQIYQLIGEPRYLRRGVARRLTTEEKTRGNPGYRRVLRLQASLLDLCCWFQRRIGFAAPPTAPLLGDRAHSESIHCRYARTASANDETYPCVR